MNSALAALLTAIFGNPITGIPGAIGLLATAGPAVSALGAAMTMIGGGGSFWSALGALAGDAHVMTFLTSIGLVGAKDFRVTGGTVRQ